MSPSPARRPARGGPHPLRSGQSHRVRHCGCEAKRDGDGGGAVGVEVHRGGTGPPAAQRAGGRLGRRVKAEVCGCRLQLQRVKESAAPGKGGREGGTWCASGRATEAQAAVGARGAESAGQYALEWVGGAAKRGGAGRGGTRRLSERACSSGLWAPGPAVPSGSPKLGADA